MHDSSFIVASALAEGGCTEAIQSPGIDLASGVNSKRVVRATPDVDDVLRETELSGLKTIQPVALHDPATELILLS